MTRRKVPNTKPCDQRDRCLKKLRYGNHNSFRNFQREYCFDATSRSGPNINPPKRKPTVATPESHMSRVARNVAPKTGAASITVIASWVFPLGIKFLA